ncbi:type II secretion system GspH family protein [Patescibacteria group bacterium]|nr:type II secretion system GspH family protein [Patescibacteria group bacterium]
MRAFTLIETITTVAIVSIILVVVAESVMQMYRSQESSIEQGIQIANARAGVAQFTRDVREASYADTGAYPLAAIGTSTITFYADTDSDESVERIQYSLIGTQLVRSVTEAGVPPTYAGVPEERLISAHVRNSEDGVPLFRYYANRTEIAATSSVSLVDAVSIMPVVDIFTEHLPFNVTLLETATLRALRTP